MDTILLIVFLFGGFLLSLIVAISYFFASRIDLKSKLILGISCLLPLVSFTLLNFGFYASGDQIITALPCFIAVIGLLIGLAIGKPPIFRCSPIRGCVGILSISWAAITSFAASHHCFMGACC